jgi:hypothetical protein
VNSGLAVRGKKDKTEKIFSVFFISFFPATIYQKFYDIVLGLLALSRDIPYSCHGQISFALSRVRIWDNFPYLSISMI